MSLNLTHGYYAQCHICRHNIAISVDSADKKTAEFVSGLILAGYSVRRDTIEAIRGMAWCSCPKSLFDDDEETDVLEGLDDNQLAILDAVAERR